MKNICIVFEIDEHNTLLILKDQVATLNPMILGGLDISRQQLRSLFKTASKLAAIKTACPMRVVAKEREGEWRLALVREPDPERFDQIIEKARAAYGE